MSGTFSARAGILVSALAALALLLSVGASTAGADEPNCYGLTPTITGSPGDDPTLDGTSGDDVILGLGGNDTIRGMGGKDVICGGDGNDTITTTGGNDAVAGQDGTDTISTGAGKDFLDGGRGNDTCSSGGQAGDQVFGCTKPTQYLVGQQAPDFTAQTAFGNTFRLSDLRGQNVLIDFSSMWCAPSASMSPVLAGVQSNLRAHGVKFTYVLAEIDDQTPNHAADRVDAETMTERYSLYNSPVLSGAGSEKSAVATQMFNYDSENNAYDPPSGNNRAFPTLVFINAAGKITEIHFGALTGQDIEDHYKSGLPEPASISGQPLPLPGVDVDTLRGQVQALGIAAKAKTKLKSLLNHSLRAMEIRLVPKVSACGYLKQFRGAVKATKGLSGSKRNALIFSALAIEHKIGCF